MTKDGLRLVVPEGRQPGKNRRRLIWILLGCAAAAAALLALLPAARGGLAALLNGLMAESEAVNAYAYRRIPEPAAPDTAATGILLGLAVLCLLGAGLLRFRRAAALAAAAVCAALQVYFGLPLPPAVNIAVFTLCGIAAAEEIRLRRVLGIALAAAVLAGMTAALRPGVDEATEAASERVRDLLERSAASVQAYRPEAEPEPIRETRHTDTRELAQGEAEAAAEQEYRLVTVEEEEISRPKWIDYLRIAALLIAAVAAVVLPFIPAAALNRRRRKAREARAAFASPDRKEAVCAMFRHAAKYLEKTGNSPGNLPFREWPAFLEGRMPEKYVDSFRKCCILFEEAAYSDHELTEGDEGEVRDLLAETEHLLYDRAGLRQRLRLRYVECLHE